MLLALIWKFDFPPFMVLIIAILNDGTFLPLSLKEVEVETQKGYNAIQPFDVMNRYHNDYIKGSCKTIPTTRQLEAG